MAERDNGTWELTLEDAASHLFYRSRVACDRSNTTSGSRGKLSWNLADIGAARVVAQKVKEMGLVQEDE